MHTDLGAYDAKTKLPEMLRNVAKGNSYTITKHGVAVADLIPTQNKAKAEAKAAIEQLLILSKPTTQFISDEDLHALRAHERK